MLCIEGYNRVFRKDVIYKIVAQISFFKKRIMSPVTHL